MADRDPLALAKRMLKQIDARIPEGYPQKQFLEVTTTLCVGCGSKQNTSRFGYLMLKGMGLHRHYCNGGEKVYDVTTVVSRHQASTPRCEACIRQLPPDATFTRINLTPPPPLRPKDADGRVHGSEPAGATKKPKVEKSLDDLLKGF